MFFSGKLALNEMTIEQNRRIQWPKPVEWWNWLRSASLACSHDRRVNGLADSLDSRVGRSTGVATVAAHVTPNWSRSCHFCFPAKSIDRQCKTREINEINLSNFTKPNILSFLVLNEVLSKFYLYIYLSIYIIFYIYIMFFIFFLYAKDDMH